MNGNYLTKAEGKPKEAGLDRRREESPRHAELRLLELRIGRRALVASFARDPVFSGGAFLRKFVASSISCFDWAKALVGPNSTKHANNAKQQISRLIIWPPFQVAVEFCSRGAVFCDLLGVWCAGRYRRAPPTSLLFRRKSTSSFGVPRARPAYGAITTMFCNIGSNIHTVTGIDNMLFTELSIH